MIDATQITIDDRPYAAWKRQLFSRPSKWVVRTAIPREARLFAPEIVAAAEAAVYAKERAAVLAYKGIREEIASGEIRKNDIVVQCPRCGRVRGFDSDHCDGPGCEDPAQVAGEINADVLGKVRLSPRGICPTCDGYGQHLPGCPDAFPE